MKNKGKQTGITLVALVVTIVVLLILAGITITYVMGDNSIFKKAQEAADKTNQAKQDEKDGLDKANDFIKKKTNKKPIIKWAGVTSKTIHSLVIEATATDENKDELTYKLYVGSSEEGLTPHGEEKKGASNETVQWEILNLEEYTKYYYKIEVTDGIDTETTKVKEVMTNRTNTAPTVANVQIESKTTNSMTIKANSTDTEEDKLTYTIYLGETADALTKQATVEEKNAGEGISFPKTGLKEYNLYYYRIDVSDEWDTTEGTVQEVRTYCSGKGEICSGGQTCNHCNAEGKCTHADKLLSATSDGYCSICYHTEATVRTYGCSYCKNGAVTHRTKTCANGHGLSDKSFPQTCGLCGGTKIRSCAHGQKEQHEMCSHGRTEQHDD